MTRVFAMMTAIASMTACVATTTPNNPTVSAAEVDRAFAEANRVSDLPFTSVVNVPTGSATYDGHIGADLTGDSLGSILGDMRMDVDFRNNRIDGSVTNINLIDQDGAPDQRFGGSLQISGFENNGDLDAGASGRISAVDNAGDRVSADMNLDLDGALRDDRGRGDAVYGSVTGDARGEFSLDVDGVFWGERR